MEQRGHGFLYKRLIVPGVGFIVPLLRVEFRTAFFIFVGHVLMVDPLAGGFNAGFAPWPHTIGAVGTYLNLVLY